MGSYFKKEKSFFILLNEYEQNFVKEQFLKKGQTDEIMY